MRPKINLNHGRTAHEFLMERRTYKKIVQMIPYRKPLAYCKYLKQFYHPKGLLIFYLN